MKKWSLLLGLFLGLGVIPAVWAQVRVEVWGPPPPPRRVYWVPPPPRPVYFPVAPMYPPPIVVVAPPPPPRFYRRGWGHPPRRHCWRW